MNNSSFMRLPVGLVALGLAISLLFAPSSWADTTDAALQNKLADAYVLMMNADKARDEGRKADAIGAYTLAAAHYREIRTETPDYKPGMVDFRIRYCVDQVEALGGGAAPAAAPTPVGEPIMVPPTPTPPPPPPAPPAPASPTPAEVAQWQAELAGLRAQATELTAKLTASEEQREAMRLNSLKLATMLKELQAKQTDMEKRALENNAESQIESLKTDAARLLSDKLDLQARLGETTGAMDTMRKELAAMNTRSAEREAQLTTVLESRSQELKMIQAEHSRLVQAVRAAGGEDADPAQWAQQLSQAREEARNKTSLAEQASAEAARTAEQLKAAEAAARKQSEDRAASEKEWVERVATLEKSMETLAGENRALTARNTELQSEQERAARMIHEVQGDREKEGAQIMELRAVMEADLKLKEQEIAKAQAERDAARKRESEMDEQQKAQVTAMAALRSEMERVVQLQNLTSSSLVEREKETLLLKAAQQTLEAELASAKAAFEEALAREKASKNEVESALTQQLAAITSERDSAQTQAKQAMEQMSTRESEAITTLKSELLEATAQRELLSKEIAEERASFEKKAVQWMADKSEMLSSQAASEAAMQTRFQELATALEKARTEQRALAERNSDAQAALSEQVRVATEALAGKEALAKRMEQVMADSVTAQDELTAQVLALTTARDEARQALVTSEEKLKIAAEEKATLAKEIETSKARQDEYTEVITTKNREMALLQQEQTSQQNVIRDLQGSLSEMRKTAAGEITILQQSLENAKKEADAQKAAELSAAAAAFQIELATVREEAAARVGEITRSLQEAETHHAAQRAQMAALEKAREDALTEANKLPDAEERLVRAQTRISALEKEISAFQERMAKADNVSRELELFRTQADQAQTAMQQRLLQTQSELEVMRGEASAAVELAGKLRDAEAALQRMSAEREAATTEVAEFRQASDLRIAQAEASAKQALADLGLTRERFVEAEAKATEFQRRLTKLTADFDGSQQLIAELRAERERHGEELSRLMPETEALRLKLSEAMAENSASGEKLVKAAGEAEALRTQLTTFEKAIGDAEQTITTLRRELQETNANATARAEMAEQLAAEIKTLRAEMGSAQIAASESAMALDKVRAEVAESRTLLEAARVESEARAQELLAMKQSSTQEAEMANRRLAEITERARFLEETMEQTISKSRKHEEDATRLAEETASLNMKLQALTAENAALTVRNQTMVDEARAFEEEKKVVEIQQREAIKELREMERKYAEMVRRDRANEDAADKLDLMNQQIASYEEKLRRREVELERSISRIADLESGLAGADERLRLELEKKDKEYAKLMRVINERTIDTDQTREKLAQYESTLSASQATIESLQTAVAARQEEMMAALDTREQKIRALVNELEARDQAHREELVKVRNEEQARLREMAGQLAEARKQSTLLQSLEQDRVILADQLAEMRKQMGMPPIAADKLAAGGESFAASVSDIKSRTAELVTGMETERAKNEALARQIVEVQQQMEGMKLQIAQSQEFEVRMVKAIEGKEQAEENVRKLGLHIAELRRQSEDRQVLSNELAQTRIRFKELEDRLKAFESLQARYTESETVRQKAAQDIDVLQRKLVEMDRQINMEKAAKEADRQKFTALQQEFAALQLELGALREAEATAKAALESTVVALEQARAQLVAQEEIEARLVANTQRMAMMEERLVEHEGIAERVADLQNSLAESRMAAEAVRSALEQREKALADSIARSTGLESRIETMQNDLAQARETAKSAGDREQELAVQVQKMSREINRLAAGNQELSATFDLMQKELLSARDQLGRMEGLSKEQWEAMQAENARLRQVIAEKDAGLAASELQVQELNRQLQDVVARLRRLLGAAP